MKFFPTAWNFQTSKFFFCHHRCQSHDLQLKEKCPKLCFCFKKELSHWPILRSFNKSSWWWWLDRAFFVHRSWVSLVYYSLSLSVSTKLGKTTDKEQFSAWCFTSWSWFPVTWCWSRAMGTWSIPLFGLTAEGRGTRSAATCSICLRRSRRVRRGREPPVSTSGTPTRWQQTRGQPWVEMSRNLRWPARVGRTQAP